MVDAGSKKEEQLTAGGRGCCSKMASRYCVSSAPLHMAFVVGGIRDHSRRTSAIVASFVLEIHFYFLSGSEHSLQSVGSNESLHEKRQKLQSITFLIQLDLEGYLS